MSLPDLDKHPESKKKIEFHVTTKLGPKNNKFQNRRRSAEDEIQAEEILSRNKYLRPSISQNVITAEKRKANPFENFQNGQHPQKLLKFASQMRLISAEEKH